MLNSPSIPSMTPPSSGYYSAWKLRRLCLAVSALSGALSLPALAQSTQAVDNQQIQEITVFGQNRALQKAQERKRLSAAILDAVSSDEIGNLPHRNSAEAIEALAGVSLAYDQGEGRFVTIRGASPNLNNVTINGISAGTPEGDGRTVPLDVIGGELLSTIEVIKAVTPDMDAQGVGGTINVVPASPFDHEGFFAAGSIQNGFEENSGDNPFAADVTVGNRFGRNDQWGALFGGNFSERNFVSKGIFPDDWVENDLGGAQPEAFKQNHYEIDRTRFGFNGALEYQTEENHYFLRAFFSEFQEDEFRQRIEYEILRDPQFSSDTSGSTSDGEAESELRVEEKDKNFINLSVGGENQINNWQVDYSLTYVDTETVEPNERWEFRADGLDFEFDTSRKLPDVTPGANAQDPNNFEFARFREQDQLIEQESWVADLNIQRDGLFGSLPGFVKFGAKIQTTDKLQDVEEPRWVDGDTAFSFGSEDLTGESIEDRINGRVFPMGPLIDFVRAREFTAANIDNANLFEFDEEATREDGFLDDFDLTEDIYAGYVMANVELGDFKVIGGLRVEHTDTQADGYELANSEELSTVSNSGSYTNLLPNLHVHYQASDQLLLRAAWTNTIGRPGYGQIVPTRELEFDEFSPGVFQGELSEGNPDLDPFESMNLDFSAEYYFSDLGMISAAAFYKEVDNPIFGERVTETDITFEGRFFEELEFQRPANAKEGTIKGIELSYQQRLAFLPAPFDGFGIVGSATLVDSDLEVPGREDEDLPFIGQADEIYSAQISYQKGPFQGVVSYDYAGSFLDSLEGSPETDLQIASFGRLDARLSFDITDGITIFGELENLNDEPLREIQGGNADWITGYETYGRTSYIGLNAHF